MCRNKSNSTPKPGTVGKSRHYPLVFLFAISVIPGHVFANEKPGCEQIYQQLSIQHNEAIAQHTENSSAYFQALHTLEDKLFIVFKTCPDNALLFTLMGETQISLGNIGLAYLYARKALRLDSTLWQTQHLLGTTLCMQQNFTEGLPYLEQATTLAPDRPALLFNLCSVYHRAEKFEQAVATCSKLLERRDHRLHGPAFYLRGQSYQALGKTIRAKQDFTNAAALGFKHSE